LGKKILIVEDDLNSAKLLRDVLTFRGYSIIEATNGKDGIAMIKAEKPDLILMDVQMPVMDGISVIKSLKADSDFSTTPVLFVTADVMKSTNETLRGIGANDVIAKPIDIPHFIQTVEKYLKGE
jgi:CheY-like chemotaxis protein